MHGARVDGGGAGREGRVGMAGGRGRTAAITHRQPQDAADSMSAPHWIDSQLRSDTALEVWFKSFISGFFPKLV